MAHDGRRPDAGAVMARPRLNGGQEPLCKEGLRGLDRHHPPGESLTANRLFYAIGALAYNRMKAGQLLCLPEQGQSWTVPTLLKQMGRRPAPLGRPARALVARVEVAVSWLDWWRSWATRWWRAEAPLTPAPTG